MGFLFFFFFFVGSATASFLHHEHDELSAAISAYTSRRSSCSDQQQDALPAAAVASALLVPTGLVPTGQEDSFLVPLKAFGFSVALGSCPDVRMLRHLESNLGLTHLVTLLGDQKEGVSLDPIKKAMQSSTTRWLHVPMNGTPGKKRPLFPALQEKMKEAISEILDAAAVEELRRPVGFVLPYITNRPVVVFIHCAFGMHRTGLFAHALLLAAGRKAGFSLQESKNTALAIVRAARKGTGEEAETAPQQFRLQLAEAMVESWGCGRD